MSETLALKMRFGVADLHGLLLVTLPPPADVEGQSAKPTILRALSPHAGAPGVGDPAGVWSIEIGSRLMKLIGETGSIVRYHGEIDRALGFLLSDPVRYAAYHAGARMLQVAGITSEKIDEVERLPPYFAHQVAAALGVVGSLHRDFLEKIGSDTLGSEFGWGFERMSALAGAEEIPGGEAPAEPGAEPPRKIVLSSSPVKGVAAVQIGIGSIISPEANRGRRYKVHSIEAGAEKDTLVFYVDPLGGGPRSYFTALELERIEVTTGVEAERLKAAFNPVEEDPSYGPSPAPRAEVPDRAPASATSRALLGAVAGAGILFLLLLFLT